MLEDKNMYLHNGLQRLREGNFFDAHEEWEIPWKTMSGHVRSFWQAMIQLSVGAYHYENRNMTGCINLWNKALRHCRRILAGSMAKQPHYVTQLQIILQECLRKAETGENPLPDVQAFAREVVNEAWFDFQ